MDYVTEALDEFRALAPRVQAAAARRLDLEAGSASADASPEGIPVMNYITSNERGFDHALRRIELGRKPDRPGPKRGPKTPEAAPTAGPEPESDPEPVEVSIAVAADVQEPVAAEVPAGDVATPITIQATDIEQNLSASEATEEPAPAQPSADSSTSEAIERPVQAQAAADFAELEAVLDVMEDGSGLEPDSPEFVRLCELGRKIEATYSAGLQRDVDPGPGRQPDAARGDSPLARAEERFRRRQEDLSRQSDAHFGWNGARPEPTGPEPVSDHARGPDNLKPGDTS